MVGKDDDDVEPNTPPLAMDNRIPMGSLWRPTSQLLFMVL